WYTFMYNHISQDKIIYCLAYFFVEQGKRIAVKRKLLPAFERKEVVLDMIDFIVHLKAAFGTALRILMNLFYFETIRTTKFPIYTHLLCTILFMFLAYKNYITLHKLNSLYRLFFFQAVEQGRQRVQMHHVFLLVLILRDSNLYPFSFIQEILAVILFPYISQDDIIFLGEDFFSDVLWLMLLNINHCLYYA
ncbi:hypothetical protein ACJX0J_031157, partial [Zea mays]